MSLWQNLLLVRSRREDQLWLSKRVFCALILMKAVMATVDLHKFSDDPFPTVTFHSVSFVAVVLAAVAATWEHQPGYTYVGQLDYIASQIYGFMVLDAVEVGELEFGSNVARILITFVLHAIVFTKILHWSWISMCFICVAALTVLARLAMLTKSNVLPQDLLKDTVAQRIVTVLPAVIWIFACVVLAAIFLYNEKRKLRQVVEKFEDPVQQQLSVIPQELGKSSEPSQAAPHFEEGEVEHSIIEVPQAKSRAEQSVQAGEDNAVHQPRHLLIQGQSVLSEERHQFLADRMTSIIAEHGCTDPDKAIRLALQDPDVLQLGSQARIFLRHWAHEFGEEDNL
mmetsp:Transcript_1049/g.2149  ORF Transcript_1049/g.2149 Transcript_1049/m.2149 type:complete len:340 (-) Transcript_1049:120-1139(-)